VFETLYPGQSYAEGTVYAYAPTLSDDGMELTIPFGDPETLTQQGSLWQFHWAHGKKPS
jgi:hypothetical protein